MLVVGIAWAEAQPAACLLDPGGPIVCRRPVPHAPAGLRRRQTASTEGEPEPDPAAVRVALARPGGSGPRPRSSG
jgi:hypothetical protein